jgi:hypothetical protein
VLGVEKDVVLTPIMHDTPIAMSKVWANGLVIAVAVALSLYFVLRLMLGIPETKPGIGTEGLGKSGALEGRLEAHAQVAQCWLEGMCIVAKPAPASRLMPSAARAIRRSGNLRAVPMPILRNTTSL